MFTDLPEDVSELIGEAIIKLPNGLQGEKRESMRKLRDSILLNLSLTSNEVSPLWLSLLRRNMTLNQLGTASVLPSTLKSPSPFAGTRSLRFIDITQSNSEFPPQFAERIMNTHHPVIEPITTRWISKIRSGNPHILGWTRQASTDSIVIDSMPNLQWLAVLGALAFQFVKLDGGIQSRPLSGLSSLKILRVENSSVHSITASNCCWLMIFLENLTHLQITVQLCSKDKVFLESHREVLTGKSKVTHLDLSFKKKEDKKDRFGENREENVILQMLLFYVTQGLIELKLHHTAHWKEKAFNLPQLSWLLCLKASSDSLKYLCVVGTLGGIDEDLGIKGPSSIKFRALEMIALDCLSVSAFMNLNDMERSFIKLSLPILSSFHLSSADTGGRRLTEINIVKWINHPSFPETMKKIYVGQEPIDGFGRVTDLGDSVNDWNQAKAELVRVCSEKKLNLKFLKSGEKLPFGGMPEPEDLL